MYRNVYMCTSCLIRKVCMSYMCWTFPLKLAGFKNLEHNSVRKMAVMSKALYSVFCWQIFLIHQNSFIFFCGGAEIVSYTKFGKPFISKQRVIVSHSTIQIQCTYRRNRDLLKLVPVLVKLEPRGLNIESIWKPYTVTHQGISCWI